MDNNPTRVWLDMETTGLEPFRVSSGSLIKWDVPLELGIVLTENDGRFIAEKKWLIWQDEDPVWHLALDRAQVHDIVGPMHRSNGLFDDLANPDKMKQRPGIVASEAMAFMTEYGVAPGTPELHGSSVYTDRIYMRVYQPLLEQFFHYRNIDISSFKQECRRINPALYAKLDTAWDRPTKAHRVLEDCHDSISEWGFYAENFLFNELSED